MAHCIPVTAGGTPPCAGSWRMVGDALYPADAATARAANLDFPPPPLAAPPAPAPAATTAPAPAAAPAPATNTTTK